MQHSQRSRHATHVNLFKDVSVTFASQSAGIRVYAYLYARFSLRCLHRVDTPRILSDINVFLAGSPEIVDRNPWPILDNHALLRYKVLHFEDYVMQNQLRALPFVTELT